MRIKAAVLVLGLLAANPVFAEENNRQPPAVGTSPMLSPRLGCDTADAIPSIFKGTVDFDDVKVKARILGMMAGPTKGRPLCLFWSKFLSPLTILDETRVGHTILPLDKSEFDAWNVHGKFPDGKEIWVLWLEMTIASRLTWPIPKPPR